MSQPGRVSPPVSAQKRVPGGRPLVSTLHGAPRSSGRGQVVTMDKWLCWGSLGVAGFLLLLFVLDIALGLPFGGFTVVDIFGIIACGVVAYLAWDASRELQ